MFNPPSSQQVSDQPGNQIMSPADQFQQEKGPGPIFTGSQDAQVDDFLVVTAELDILQYRRSVSGEEICHLHACQQTVTHC